MTTPNQIETHINGAEVHHGDICREKVLKLVEEFAFPKGLFPLKEIKEFGFNRSTGFFWLRLDKKKEHKFKSLGKTVVYDPEITAFVEKGHLYKMTGVKAKELFVLVVVCDIVIGKPSVDMVKFTSSVGLSRAYPVSAFEVEEVENGGK